MLIKPLKHIIYKRTQLLQVVILLSISFIITLLITDVGNYSKSIPNQKLAVIDLSSWDFDKSGIVNLKDNWEFYWNKLYINEDLNSDSIKPDIYADVPDVWNNYKINGKNLPGFGYATYRVKVKVKNPNILMALKIPTMSTSYKLYIDDKLVASNGEVGTKAKDFKPQFKPLVVNFLPPKSEFSVIVQVSNYSYARGGMWYNIQLGTSAQINSVRENLMQRDAFLVGGLLIITIYYLNFFFARHREKISFVFVVTCFLATLRMAIYGNCNIYLISQSIPYKMNVFIEYIWTFLIPELFFILIAYIFPEESSKKIIKCSIVINILELLLIILLPIHIYTGLVYAFEVIDTVEILFGVIISIKAYARRKSNSVITITACILTIIGFTHDMFYENNAIFNVNCEMGPITIFIAIVLNSFILARKFSEAYNESEKLSFKLTNALKKQSEMAEQLVKMDKLKDEFLANTSHELRTPLNGIIIMAESMMKGADGPFNDIQKKDLSIIISSGRRLSNLVNDILDISKLKNNEIKLYKKSLDINNVISSIAKVFEFLNTNHKVKIILNISPNLPYVLADENRFQQIMYNLIGNALKFTLNGSITIYTEETNNDVKIIVEDTGKGIPKDKIPLIWKAFEQLDCSLTRNYGGAGLGLYITKQLVELHGGTITVESEPDKGSKFSFTLPKSKELPDSTKDYDNESFALDIAYKSELDIPEKIIQNGDSILVVDDDIINLHSIINLLKLHGYSITPVNSGINALKELEADKNYSLVILDVMMPEMSGYEVCRKIRETNTIYDLPILMLTANNQPESIVLSFKEGANDFLTKPFESNELLARVRTLVELKQSVSKALDMEMAFLQAQIKPHFLFNVLNTIAELCDRNPEDAGDLIIELANYLRSSFDFTNLQEVVSLEKELDYINSYLKLEQARFGDKLKVEYDFKFTKNIMIPPLILQPIVENSVRHGIRGKYQGGTIKISVKREKTGISINVWDNGKGISEEKLQELLDMKTSNNRSVGLKNINMRLKRLYGNGLKITSTEGVETNVEIFIPKHEEDEYV